MAKCESCQLFSQECSGSQRSMEECNGVYYQPKPKAQDGSTKLTTRKTLEEVIAELLSDNGLNGLYLIPEILSAIQSKYVLLAENQTPPENPYHYLASSFYDGFKEAVGKFITPVLNPDKKTYRVWVAVNVTKEQMETLGK